MTGEHNADPLSPGERDRLRAIAPNIRAASVYGGRRPELARTLRRESTAAEDLLWHHLRNRALAGLKFRRQQAMGPYILDFYCHKRGLAIEVDGGQHFEPEQEARDQERSRWLESAGLRVLRFSNSEVLNRTDLVLDQILTVAENKSPSPSP